MQSFAFGVHTTPPLMDPNVIMQRSDDVNVVQRMLTDAQTSTVMLVGDAGVGKSTLAALIYHRLLLTKQANMPAPSYLVWITINSYTTLADLLAAILYGVAVQEENFPLLKPEQQIALVLRALQRQQENALIVFDQFEAFVHTAIQRGSVAQKGLQLLLGLLQTDLGSSRLLLTSHTAPFDEQTMEQTRIRQYLVSRISIPEGVALLQQRGVKGTPEELSLVWQRCGGHVFSLLLFSTLVLVSGIAPGYLLLAPEHQSLWSSNIAPNMLAMLYQQLSPMQKLVLRALSLCIEPVPLQAITMTITGDTVPDSEQFSANIGRELQMLTSLSLVQSVQDSVLEVFFTLHPMIQRYVQERYLENTNQPAERDLNALVAGHVNVANYYFRLAQQHYPSKEQRTKMQNIEPLINALRHLCLGQQWQRACDVLFKEGLHESLVRWGAWNTLIDLYIALVPPFSVLTLHDTGLLFSHLAMLYGRMGEAQQSQIYFEQALKIQHETEDTHGEAVTLTNQGELYRIHGEQAQAHINFEKAIMLSRQQPDQQRQQEIHLQSVILHNMGLLYHEAKDYDPALSCYVYALRLTYKLQSQYDQGTILTNLGLMLYEQSKQREGVAVLLAALQLRKALPDPGVMLLERFFIALEQRIGSNAYAQLCQFALGTQQQIFAQLMQTSTV